MDNTGNKRPDAQTSGESDSAHELRNVDDGAARHLAGSQISETVISHEEFLGPIPHPQTLAQYKSVDSDLPNRIMKMAEDEQSTNHALKTKALEATIKHNSSGQRYALIVSVLTILCSTLLIAGGYELYGSLFFGSTVVGLAYVFIAGRKKGNKPSDNEF